MLPITGSSRETIYNEHLTFINPKCFAHAPRVESTDDLFQLYKKEDNLLYCRDEPQQTEKAICFRL